MAVADYDFHLFDLDGTPSTTGGGRTPGASSTASATGSAAPFPTGRRTSSGTGSGGARGGTLRDLGIDPDAFWPAFHAEEDPDARAEATYLHDDAARLLDRVDDTGGPTGLVTHCQRFLAEPVLDRLDLSDRFDAVVCCTDDETGKPDPDPIELAMTDLDVNPQSDRGYYVGDGESDVSAAWNAGLDAVHVERVGHEDRGRCVLGDRRVSRLDELLAGG